MRSSEPEQGSPLSHLVRITRRLALVLLGTLCGVATLELCIRLTAVFDQNYLDRLDHRAPRNNGEGLRLADLIRVNRDDRIAYELRPGVQGTFLGQEISINSLGYRDPERVLKKAPNVFRIVGLGDSHMFGFGVPREGTFLAILENMLNQHFPERRYEAWNLAVPGYNTVQEVAAFLSRIDLLSPDLVIINYVNNDMDLPNFIAERPKFWTLRRSLLAELLQRRWGNEDPMSLLPYGLRGVAQDPRNQRFDLDAKRVPKRFRALAGWENMQAAFDRLAVAAKDRDITPVLLINMDDYANRLASRTADIRPGPVRELAQHCANEGYLVVDPQDRVFRYLGEHHLDTSAVWLSTTDSHTNALRHRLLAEELMNALAALRRENAQFVGVQK